MQPVYKQLAHEQQIGKQLSGLNPFSPSNNKKYRLRESGVCNKRKIIVKWAVHHNTDVSKALLGF